LAWTPPEPVTLTVLPESSSFYLPVRSPRADDANLRPLPDPEGAPALAMQTLKVGNHNWYLHRDLAQDESTLEVIIDQGRFLIEEIDTEIQRKTLEWYTFQDHDFASPRGETYTKRVFRRSDWHVKVITHTILTCDPGNFHIHARLDAYEGERRV